MAHDLNQQWLMPWPEGMRLFGVTLPAWMRKGLRVLGLMTVMNVVLRYTFVGELLERWFRDASGEDLINDAVPKSE